MGLLSLFSSSQPAAEEQRANEVRSGAVAPSRSERAKCWAARDAYFACLDANSIIDAVAEDGKARNACGPQSAAFEQDCAAQWVIYFKKWRVADMQKKARIAALEAEGAAKLDSRPDLTAGPGKR